MGIDKRLEDIRSIMTEKGWEGTGSSNAVKRDASGSIIAKSHSTEYARDIEEACKIIDAREVQDGNQRLLDT